MKRLITVATTFCAMTVAQISFASFCDQQHPCDQDYSLQYHMNYHEDLKPKPCPPPPCANGFKKQDHTENYRLQYQAKYPAKQRDEVHRKDIVNTHCGVVTVSPKFKVVYKDRIRSFHNLVADGHTVVIIDKKMPKNTIKMVTKHVYPTKLIDYKVKRNTLYLSRFTKRNWNKIAQQPVIVYVNTAYINNITLNRGASLFTDSIRGDHVKLHLKNFGNIRLRGQFAASEIIAEGTGYLDMQWVKVHRLRVVQTGDTRLKLAGQVNVLNIRAIDCAITDAQFLRAKNAIVQTADNATVKVTAINALSGFASDFSNILYFKTPKHLSRHNYASGNVMQMRHWN